MPKRNLFITGSNARNWLDISKLETPASPVIMRRDKLGNVTLTCRITDPLLRLEFSKPVKEGSLSLMLREIYLNENKPAAE